MARKKLEQPPKASGLPLWLGTFGDLMSLLLTFFILLLSMATFDKEKIDSALGSLQGALSVLEHGKETEITTPSQVQATPITRDSPNEDVMNVFAGLITEYSEMMNVSDGPGIGLEESEDGFIIRIPSDLLFATGGTTIQNPAGAVFLERLAMQLDAYRDTLNLQILGNTDNVAYKSTSAIDNWDLSHKRALSVAESLLNLGIPADIMKVGGNGEFSPIASNATDSGRAQNRRVDIHFSLVGDVKDNSQKAQKIIESVTK